jgi:hypothetical protein
LLASRRREAHDAFQVRRHEAVLAGAITQTSTLEQPCLVAGGQASRGTSAAHQSAQLGLGLTVISRALGLAW